MVSQTEWACGNGQNYPFVLVINHSRIQNCQLVTFFLANAAWGTIVVARGVWFCLTEKPHRRIRVGMHRGTRPATLNTAHERKVAFFQGEGISAWRLPDSQELLWRFSVGTKASGYCVIWCGRRDLLRFSPRTGMRFYLLSERVCEGGSYTER